MIVSGRLAISPRYIRDIRIEEDKEGVMLRVVATMQGGGKVVLKQINQYEENSAPYKIYGYYEYCLKEMDRWGYGKASG